MFYYYGAKNTLARYYPAPKHNLIIEPFSGSAAYTCYHLMKNSQLRAILIDKDDNVAQTWNFLLKCSIGDIENYPTPLIGEYAYDFIIKTCTVSNAAAKCKKMKYTERLDRVFQIQKRRILKMLSIRDRIQFVHASYEDINNYEATWFIDPPYQIIAQNKTVFQNGDGYSKNCGTSQIDYSKLSEYCINRNGQVIVCEKNGANWLPFEEFRTNKTSINTTYKEMIYVN